MPYTVDSDNLPTNVKKLSSGKKSQWVKVFNSCLDDGKAENTCFAIANGVVKKSLANDVASTADMEVADEATLTEAEKSYQYVDSWDITSRAYTQTEAGYNPVGGTNEKACSNCRWFIAPGRCSIVSGDIVPNGLSNLWAAVPTYNAEPMPVVIVKPTEIKEAEPAKQLQGAGNTTVVGSVVKKAKSLAELVTAFVNVGHSAHNVPVQSGLVLYKKEDGTVRFFMRASNNYKDKHKEIISEAAHKEYVDWASENKLYPELLLWHVPQSKFGTVDWLEYADGFLCASGTIDKGFEERAEKLATQEVGVSHGFIGLLNPESVFEWYRSFEVSVLPRGSAANVWTNFLSVEKDNDMAFSQKKHDWLIELGLPEDTVKAWESDTENQAAKLKALGIEFKSDESVSFVEEIRSVGNSVTKLAEVVGTLIENNKGLEEKQKALEIKVEKSQDELVSETITAAVATVPGGHVATKSADNVVKEGEKEVVPDAQKSWFNDVVDSVVKG